MPGREDAALLELELEQPIDAIAPVTPAPISNHAAEGVAFAVVGFAWWGSILPIYIWAFTRYLPQTIHVHPVSAKEVFVSRILFGLPILAIMISHRGTWGEYRRAFTNRATLLHLLASTALIGVNWYIYTWAVSANRTSEGALGYYINPLVSVALGMLFLHERARPMQWVAFVLAFLGVAHEAMVRGGLPWVSLSLAGTFGLYGFVRKLVKAEATVGLAVETTLLYIPSAAMLIWLMSRGEAAFLGKESPWWLTAGVMLSGFMTVIPLVCYTAGARRLRLSTLGILQYIAPTGQFIFAVTMFGEHFDPRRIITFVLIWAGLVVFSVDSVRAARRAAQA